MFFDYILYLFFSIKALFASGLPGREGDGAQGGDEVSPTCWTNGSHSEQQLVFDTTPGTWKRGVEA